MISYGLSINSPVLPLTESAFNSIVDSPAVKQLCDMIAAEPDHKKQGEIKRRLPFFCFHASFKGKRRVAKDAIPSGLAMIDVDGVDGPKEIWERIKDKAEQYHILLAHITPSTKGLRIVARIKDQAPLQLPPGGGLEVSEEDLKLASQRIVETQQWLVRELNLPKVDSVVKDLSRCSFAIPRDYILYGPTPALWGHPLPLDREGNVTDEAPVSEQKFTKGSDPLVKVCSDNTFHSSLYNGREYKDIIKAWLSIYLRKKPGYTSFEAPAEGDRNNTLYDLCRDLRNICDYSFQKILDVVPDFGLQRAEVEQTVLSALKSERRTPYILNQALKSPTLDPSRGSELDSDGELMDNNAEIEALNESYLEQMPVLPPLMKAVLNGAERRFHMPIILGLLPMLCSYADKIVYRFADGRWRRPNLMSLIVGPPMSGKSSITSQLAPVMQPMNEESKAVRDEQDEARKKNNEKSDKERGKTFEKFIKKLNMDITDAELLYNQKSANKNGTQVGEHFLPRKQFMFSEEAGVVMKAAKNDKLMSAWRIAFDNGEWGKDAHADQAVSGMVNLSFDFTALCTMGVLQKLLDPSNIENGTASRILIGLMPGAHFEEMPWFEEKKKKDASLITDAVMKIREMQEVIDSKPLIKAITKWSNDIARECEETKDYDRDMLRRRAGIVGQTASILYALLEDKKRRGNLQISQNAIAFGLLIANYNLEVQLLVFKDYAKTASVKIEFTGERKRTKNKVVFDTLNDVFTIADVMKAKGCSRKTAQKAIERFKSKGLIVCTENETYKKKTYEDTDRTKV